MSCTYIQTKGTVLTGVDSAVVEFGFGVAGAASCRVLCNELSKLGGARVMIKGITPGGWGASHCFNEHTRCMRPDNQSNLRTFS